MKYIKVVKYEVWHGGEIYNTYRNEEEAKKAARIVNRNPGSV